MESKIEETKGITQADGKPVGVHPQQNVFKFGAITFDSCFDSGNLAKAERSRDDYVILIRCLVYLIQIVQFAYLCR